MKFILCLANFLIVLNIATQEELQDVEIKVLLLPKSCPRKVEKGDFVRYHYYGMLEDGTYFDSSYDRGNSYGTYVGSGWLISGMDAALIGMCINEHRIVRIPPHLAYGEEGTEDGEIPGNATILFNFVLLDIWNENDDIEVTSTYIPEDCSRTLEATDYVRYHYNGTLLNGKPFHSSYEEDSTYDTYVGQGWVITGMDEGLIGVCMGERRTIIIPPHKAYGEKGDGKNIPRSSSIKFDVEIVDFHNPKDKPQITTTTEVEDCERKLEESDFVRYHYYGKLMDGTLFDSSYQRNRTYDTYVGMRKIIPGMEEGLLGSCMGEHRTIIIPPHLAYGERGVADKIPPSAVLQFDIHVIDFHNPKDEVVIKTIELPEHCITEGPKSRKAENDNYLTYDFEIKLMDGTIVESSSDRTGTWGIYLGKGDVVPGVDRGMVGMCVGEKRELTIPPHIAFGEPGQEPDIPGSAVVIFTIELHSIEDSLPDGFQFMWVEQSPPEEDLFKEIDEDADEFLSLPELTSFILNQVELGHALLLPGYPREEVITDIFENLDKNENGKLEREEFTLKYPDSYGNKVDDEL